MSRGSSLSRPTGRKPVGGAFRECGTSPGHPCAASGGVPGCGPTQAVPCDSVTPETTHHAACFLGASIMAFTFSGFEFHGVSHSTPRKYPPPGPQSSMSFLQ